MFAVAWTMSISACLRPLRHERLSAVHGAGGGWVWDDLAERLEKAGHRVRVVDQLPSAGTDPGSLGDLTADANHVRQVLDTIDEPVCWWAFLWRDGHHRASRPSEGAAQRLSRRVLAAARAVLAGPPRWRGCRIGSFSAMTARWRSPTISSCLGSLCADLDRDRTQDALALVLQSAASFAAQARHPIGHPTTYVMLLKSRTTASRWLRRKRCRRTPITWFGCQPRTWCSFLGPLSWPRRSDESDPAICSQRRGPAKSTLGNAIGGDTGIADLAPYPPRQAPKPQIPLLPSGVAYRCDAASTPVRASVTC